MVITPGSLDGAPGRLTASPRAPYFELSRHHDVDRGAHHLRCAQRQAGPPAHHAVFSPRDHPHERRHVRRPSASTTRRVPGADAAGRARPPRITWARSRRARLRSTSRRARWWRTTRTDVALCARSQQAIHNFMAEHAGQDHRSGPASSPSRGRRHRAISILEGAGIQGGYVLTNARALRLERPDARPPDAPLRAVHRDSAIRPISVRSLPPRASTALGGGSSTGAERHLRGKTGTLSGVTALVGLRGLHRRAPVAFLGADHGLADRSAASRLGALAGSDRQRHRRLSQATPEK